MASWNSTDFKFLLKWKLVFLIQINRYTQTKMKTFVDTGLGKHIQRKNKQNGSKACNQFKGFTCSSILRFCHWLWNLVTQVAFTTVNWTFGEPRRRVARVAVCNKKNKKISRSHFWVAFSSWCTTFHIEMSLICQTMNVQWNLISTYENWVVCQDSFWNRGNNNSEMPGLLWLWLCWALKTQVRKGKRLINV